MTQAIHVMQTLPPAGALLWGTLAVCAGAAVLSSLVRALWSR